MISSSSQKLRDYERKLLLPRNEDGHKLKNEQAVGHDDWFLVLANIGSPPKIGSKKSVLE